MQTGLERIVAKARFAASKALCAIQHDEVICRAMNQLLKSLLRENRTMGSVRREVPNGVLPLLDVG